MSLSCWWNSSWRKIQSGLVSPARDGSLTMYICQKQHLGWGLLIPLASPEGENYSCLIFSSVTLSLKQMFRTPTHEPLHVCAPFTHTHAHNNKNSKIRNLQGEIIAYFCATFKKVNKENKGQRIKHLNKCDIFCVLPKVMCILSMVFREPCSRFQILWVHISFLNYKNVCVCLPVRTCAMWVQITRGGQKGTSGLLEVGFQMIEYCQVGSENRTQSSRKVASALNR